jgi:SRSO17 transposase
MHKTLLNFVSEGAWSDEAVLAAMRPQVLPAMQAHGALRFWIVDESGMPKKGKHSVGVARQYCGEVGKVDNCQVMVSLSVANEAACLPLAAQLYLPEAWAVDEERRSRVGVPLDVVFQSKPALALEQIRAAHAAGVPPGVVLADEVYGSTASFRQGVSALGLDYAAAVESTRNRGATQAAAAKVRG